MNKLVKNFFYTFLVRCIGLLSSFLVSVCSAHFLGPQGRGEYYFVISLSALLVQLGCLGMHASNVYLLAKNENLISDLTANALWVSVIVGMSVGLVITAFNLGHSSHHVMFIVILGPASLFYLLGVNLLIGINKIKIYNFFQASTNLVLGLILFFCGWMGFHTNGFLAGTTLSGLFFAFLLIIVINRMSPLSFKFNLGHFKLGLGMGIKNYLTCLFGFLLLKTNIFMLKYFTSNEILGNYSIAAQIIDLLVTIPATFSLLLFPDIVKNPELGWKKTQQALITIGGFLFISEIFLAWIAPWGIPFVFGKQFSPSVIILWWMLPSALALGIISIMSQYLAARGFPKQLVVFWIISFVILLILSSWLIPKFSGIGAALSLSITYSLMALMVLIFSYRFQSKMETNLLSGVVHGFE